MPSNNRVLIYQVYIKTEFILINIAQFKFLLLVKIFIFFKSFCPPASPACREYTII